MKRMSVVVGLLFLTACQEDTGLNLPPEINNQPLTTNEDQTLTQIISASDLQDDELTFSLVGNPSNGSATITSDGELSYTPQLNFNGEDTLRIEVSDGELSSSALFNIQVLPVNDAPIMEDQVFTLGIDLAITGELVAEDPDGDDLSFEIELSNNDRLTIDSASGSYSFSGANSVASDYPMHYQIKVSDGASIAFSNVTIIYQTDPLFDQQWHLNNTGQNAFSDNIGSIGMDINIDDLHEQNITGDGIKVAVVDSGLEIAHPDLVKNVIPNGSYDFINKDYDPTPSSLSGDHGTSVAGLIAASAMNGIGGRGVAPKVELQGFNYLDDQSTQSWLDSHGGDKTQDTMIINQSYGFSPLGPLNSELSEFALEEEHLKEITSKSNQGRGILFVKSAGNSFQYVENAGLNFNGKSGEIIAMTHLFEGNTPLLSGTIASIEPSAASFYNLVVSALNASEQNPLATYSTVGSSVWISAPGGEDGANQPAMITTDLSGCGRGYSSDASTRDFNKGLHDHNRNCDYASNFNGTSSAAPVTSGIAALIWEANKNLSYRDIKHILATTAKRIDTDFEPINTASGYTAEPGWYQNSVGYWFHNWYGFGIPDAKAAVTLAQSENYQLLPELVVTEFIESDSSLPMTVPESLGGIPQDFNVQEQLTVEAVQVKLSLEHTRDTDIAVELTSPSGTTSVMLQPNSLLVADQSDEWPNADFDNTVLLSNGFYGEQAAGVWQLRVIDTNSGDYEFFVIDLQSLSPEKITASNNDSQGRLLEASLRIYGH